MLRTFAVASYIFLLCLSGTAHAYLDAGTGSMILQALAAGLLAAGVFFRQILAVVKGLFSKTPPRVEPKVDDTPKPDRE